MVVLSLNEDLFIWRSDIYKTKDHEKYDITPENGKIIIDIKLENNTTIRMYSGIDFLNVNKILYKILKLKTR